MVPIQKQNVEDILPLTPVQEGILFHYLDDPRSGHYFQQTVLRLTGEPDERIFRIAWCRLVNDHEALRTVFRWENLNKPVQVILKNHEPKFTYETGVVNLSDILSEDVREGVNIEEGCLRLRVIAHSDHEYTVIFSFHHILLDGWSFSLLVSGLMKHYREIKRGAGNSNPVSHKGVIKAHLNYVRGRDRSREEVFWKNNLVSYVPNRSLPYLRARKETGTGRLSVAVPADLMNNVYAFAREAKVSPATVFYAAWALLLYKTSCEGSVTFGTTTSGRRAGIPYINETIGLFINTLPLHLVVDPARKLIDFLKQVNFAAISLIEHEFASIPEIKKYAAIDPGDPLFNSLFVVENYPLTLDSTAGDMTITSVETYQHTNYDIAVAVIPFDLKSGLHFTFSRERFDEASVKKTGAHLIALLKCFTGTTKDICVGDVDLLSPAESKRIRSTLNQTDRFFKNAMTMQQCLQQQAMLFPDSVAIRYGDVRLTYGEIETASSNLAVELSQSGIGENVVVGVYMDRSPELVISAYAIFKAGGIYMPVDTSLPDHRISYMLDDSDARCILVRDGHARTIHIFGNRRVIAVNGVALLSKPVTHGYKPLDSGQHPAYIIYTSGSTGNPKGVVINHSSLINRLYWMQDMYSLSSGDVLLQKTTVGFDISIQELFWWVLAGSTLCILPPKKERDIDEILQTISNHGVTHIHFIPPMLRTFISYVDELGLHDQVRTLKRVFSGGEVLKTNDVKSFYKIFRERGIMLSNLYGPTEATIDVTYYNCEWDELQDDMVPIGKPIANTQLYILNSDQQVLPAGLDGELYIGGANVARGYVNNATLTEQRFLDNPFGNGKLYRTGDIARWDENGNVIFLGRKDTQVKIRGYRIELSEIENCFTEHPDIRDAVVVVSSDELLEAFCECTGGINGADIREFAQLRLPTYMVPARFHLVDKIPLTHNGKADRAKLRSMGVGQKDHEGDLVRIPDDQELSILLRICAEVLSVKQVKATDNFFGIGGDSIKAIRLLSLIRKAGYKLNMRDILDTPVMQELSLILKKGRPVRVRDSFEGKAYLHAIQARFFAIDAKNTDRYNQAVMIALKQDVSEKTLAHMLDCLTNHHDVFRVCFRGEGIDMETVYAKEVPLHRLVEIDLGEAAVHDRQFTEVMNALHAGFNIKEGPLAKFAYLVCSGKRYLVIVMHHLITDGVSWRILLEDLNALFTAHSAGKDLQLPETSASYGAYVNSLHEMVRNGAFETERAYWKTVCEKPGNSLFSTPRRTFTYGEFQRTSLTLPVSLVIALEMINKKLGTKTNEVLLACLGLAVKHVFQVSGLTIDIEGHGRTEFDPSIDISRTVGWLTSVYPVNIGLNGSDDLIYYTRQVKETLRAVPNNGEGFGVLKYLSGRDFDGRQPEISFNYLGDFSSFTETEFFSAVIDDIGNWYSRERKIQHPLEIFSFLDKNSQLMLTADFVNEVAGVESVERLLRIMLQSLENIAEACRVIDGTVKSPSDFTYQEIEMKKLDALLCQVDELKDIYELSPAQEGLLHYCETSGSTNDYIANANLFIEGSVSCDVLTKAYGVIIDRHDALRTIFRRDLDPGKTLQLVKKKHRAYIELKEVPAGAEAIADEWDLERRRLVSNIFAPEPNMRVCLVKLSDREFKLSVYHHHILFDGWSLVIFLSELFEVYNSICPADHPDLRRFEWGNRNLRLNNDGLENDVPSGKLEPIPSFSAYIRWLRKTDRDQAAAYWSQYLRGFHEPFEFRSERASAGQKEDGYAYACIDQADLEVIRSFVAQLNCTVYNYIQAVWAMVLSKLSGSNDLIFGQVVSGRPDTEWADRLMGLFINTIPKRVKIDEGIRFTELVRHIARDEADTLPFHHYPLADILAITPFRSRLFSHILVFENQYQLWDADKSGRNFRIKGFEGNDPNHYAVSVFVSQVHNTLKVELRYDKNMYDADYFNQVIEHFTYLTGATTRDLNRFVEDILVDVTGEMDLPLLAS